MHKSAPPCPASFSAQSSYHSSPSSSPPQSSSYNSPSPSPCYSYYYYYNSSSSSSYFASYSYSSFSSSYSYSPSSSSSPSPSCRRELHGLQGPSGAQERQARRPRGLRGHVGRWGTRLTLWDPVRSVPTIGLPMCPSRWRKTLSAMFGPRAKFGVCLRTVYVTEIQKQNIAPFAQPGLGSHFSAWGRRACRLVCAKVSA